jgi:uncharacterized membrane protein
MKGFLNILGNVLYVFTVIWDIVEFLAIPAICVGVGVWFSLPWQYYAVTVGGYFAIFIIAEVIAHFVFKALEKKYTPIIVRKLEKHIEKHSKK